MNSEIVTKCAFFSHLEGNLFEVTYTILSSNHNVTPDSGPLTKPLPDRYCSVTSEKKSGLFKDLTKVHLQT